MAKINNRYRFHIVIKAPNVQIMKQVLDDIDTSVRFSDKIKQNLDIDRLPFFRLHIARLYSKYFL
jgi:primosomal protein N'